MHEMKLRKNILSVSRKYKVLIMGILIIALLITVLLLRYVQQSTATLTMHKDTDAQPAIYNGVPIIEACNIVSLDELRAKGIELKASQRPDTLLRSYIENGQAVAPGQDLLKYPNELNSCHYDLKNDKNWFDIRVYQGSYTNLKQLDADIAANYDPEPDISGLTVFKAKTFRTVNDDFFGAVNTNKGNEDFILRHNDTVVWFRLRDFKPATRQDVLNLIATNFSKLLQKPEARVSFSYRELPIEYKIYKACDLLTLKNAATFLGQATSPYIIEGYAGAPGKRNYQTEAGTPGGHLYVAQTCSRSGQSNGGSVKLVLRQYETVEGAKHYIRSHASGDNMKQQSWQSVDFDTSDESYIPATYTSDSRTHQSAVNLRKGAVVLELSYSLSKDDTSRTKEYTDQLELLASSIIENIER